MIIEKTKDGIIFKMETIDDYVNKTAQCGDGKFLTGIASKKVDGVDVNYCVKKHKIGEGCYYLRVNAGYQRCVMYDKK